MSQVSRHPPTRLRGPRNERIPVRALRLPLFLIVLAAACDLGTEPRVATTLEKSAGDEQVERVNSTVRVSPAVRLLDQDGKPMPGATIDFSVALGGGTIGSISAVTDAAGLASPGSWTLGTSVGENLLSASVQGLAPVTFRATTTPGLPHRVSSTAGPGHMGAVVAAQVVSDVPQPPVVRVVDAFGNPVPDVPVTFQVWQGGGLVEPNTAITNSEGTATAARWRLGSSAGLNTVTASVVGAPTIVFSATATPAAPAAVAVVSGQNQSAPVGTLLPVRPAAAVTDSYGNPVAGATVTFVVTEGGGTVTDATQVTNANGVAAVGGWTLGIAIGTNALEARVEGAPPARFDATATSGPGGGEGSSFNIVLRFGSGLTSTQQAVFEQAVIRWQSIITADIPSVPVTLQANACGTHPNIDETVDDVLIYATGKAIDGVSGVLGQAGPCVLRDIGFLPVLGFMEFDTSDLAALESNGNLLAVITHEIGHVLGIGTIWELRGQLTGKGTSQPSFNGARAIGAFDAVGGAGFTGAKVPVENTGGPGTRDAHWRESVMGRELMTGFINSGLNPLSLVTIASLQDLGYQVDVSKAEPFSLSFGLRAPGPEESGQQLIERPPPPPIFVGPDGVLRPTPRE